jgi:hypothetical protein
VGTRIETRLDKDGNLVEIVMDQTEYVEELVPGEVDGRLKDDQLLDKQGHREYRGMVGSMLWAAGMTRPDIAFDVAVVAGATNAPTVADAKRALKAMKKAKRTEVYLRFPRITGPVAMVGYCDAAWGNLSDGKTGGGLFLCLAAVNPYGGNEVFCPVGWSSKRLRRVVRSTFAGETLIASEVLDEVIYLADTWAELGGGNVDRIIRTDSKSLYDHVLLKGTCKEKRLNIEINALKEALQQGELTRLEWVDSQSQLADALTKHMTALTLLRSLNTKILP